MFSLLLPPSSFYFVSQANTVLKGAFGKVKKSQSEQISGEIQAEFRNKLRMNEKSPIFTVDSYKSLPVLPVGMGSTLYPGALEGMCPHGPQQSHAQSHSQRCHPGGLLQGEG